VRVLIVEDEVHLAESLQRGLTTAGYAVDVVHDGVDGLWMIRENSYDAVILDLLLPGMNGYKVCQTLRDEKNWTPILMLTAKNGEYDEAEALDTGADDFLSKPFSFVVLLARLRALARRPSTARSPVLCAGDLSLDPVTRACARGDVAIDLTRREFALLEALLQADGAVIDKRGLLDRVWGDNLDSGSNVVEVYIRYVRVKVDDPFDRHSIVTVRGHGYRVIDDLAEPDRDD
jgi:two-component system, OmpR family, response regulator